MVASVLSVVAARWLRGGDLKRTGCLRARQDTVNADERWRRAEEGLSCDWRVPDTVSSTYPEQHCFPSFSAGPQRASTDPTYSPRPSHPTLSFFCTTLLLQMFTPPASPLPTRLASGNSSTAESDREHTHDDPCLPSSSTSRASSTTADTKLPRTDIVDPVQAGKRRTARRTKWTVLLVPAVLILIALSTRYLSHPAALDVLSADGPPLSWDALAATIQDGRVHKRHPDGSSASATTNAISFASGTSTPLSLDSPSSTVSASSTPAPSSTNGTPTIPASTPVLPTPFPQAFDQTFQQNFSMASCQNFFTNMTISEAFLQCRPFSLLLQTSDAFIESQKNLTLLNTVIWGTCNTVPSAEQLREGIAMDNTMVQTALIGLESYSVMRDAGCSADTATSTYCYVEAIASTTHHDAYLYELPLGFALPNNTDPSCSACTKNVMGLFAADGMDLVALQSRYERAAEIVNAACGGQFVQSLSAPSATSAAHTRWGDGGAAMVAAAAVLVLMAAWDDNGAWLWFMFMPYAPHADLVHPGLSRTRTGSRLHSHILRGGLIFFSIIEASLLAFFFLIYSGFGFLVGVFWCCPFALFIDTVCPAIVLGCSPAMPL
ncbi:hypothetical protein A0H81_12615 [Grifola frondosa]|uniref:DUF7729 domain-containing protein n=1 Tax=Grifola frondosa TaxID=5627 RepID=A0A1C7LS10_GRIFR|nr:hypothetical protein A0H81_12615 [Grifola frondosa]